jgi:hypothetical protein
MILDIGPLTLEHIVSVLARLKTLVWNGPLGAFETEPLDTGTVAVAEAAAELTRARQPGFDRGRWRHRGGAQCGQRRSAIDLRIGGRRRVSRMDGRQGVAGR